MKTIGLTKGDLFFDGEDFIIVDEEEELTQSLEIMMSTYLGEWFLNTDFGFNYHLALEKPDAEEVQAEIMRILSQEPRVINVLEVTVSQDLRARKSTALYVIEAVLEEGGELRTITKEVNIHGS